MGQRLRRGMSMRKQYPRSGIGFLLIQTWVNPRCMISLRSIRAWFLATMRSTRQGWGGYLLDRFGLAFLASRPFRNLKTNSGFYVASD